MNFSFLCITCILLVETVLPVFSEPAHVPYNEKYDSGPGTKRVSFFMKKEFSLTKPYPGSWDFGGSTVLLSDSVRLTPDKPSASGWLRCTRPVAARHWEVQINFKVSGSTGHLFGDGLAFWYVDPATRFDGPVFGGQNNFRGLAVFLDTYSNHNGPHSHDHPYVSAMVGNGSVAYDHDKDGTHSQLSGCSVRFRNRDHDTWLSVSYVANELTVSADVDNKGEWQHCFSVPSVRLPTGYVFALSAMTGELTDQHDVVGVRVFEVESKETAEADAADQSVDFEKLEPSAAKAEPVRDRVDDPPAGGSTAWRLLLLVACCLAAVGLAAAGLLLYRRRQERMRKRFY